MTIRPGERGYASIAAIMLIAVLATVASGLVARSTALVESVSADVEQARMAAAADAGLALALDGLLVRDRAGRWSIDGRTRRLDFDGTALTIRIEDERGKVPLNLLDDLYATRLVEAAGLGEGLRGRIAAESLVDWTDDDDEARPNGAEAAWYRRQGLRPPNGPLRSIDELARIRGFDQAAVKRLRGFVTVHFGNGGFDPRFAQPEAIEVMLEGGADSPAAIQRRRELAGQRVAIELGETLDLVGRPLTVAVTAQRTGGASLSRRTVIELTGAADRPVLIRSQYQGWD